MRAEHSCRRLALNPTSPLWGGRRASCATAQRRAGWGERSKRPVESIRISDCRRSTPHPAFFARSRSEVRPPHQGRGIAYGFWAPIALGGEQDSEDDSFFFGES